ncbi:CBS domain-containing protein, partial [Candidatus Contendibacter odensensis]|uniref:CBS domain-containing protein n=1 Tax=Candidatus Contendibacter odensensis TaxID=1400860 RepID=UPI0006889C45
MEALKVRVEQETGAVLVLDGVRVAGLFSDRDFIRHGASGGGPARLTPIREAIADCTAFVTSTHTAPQCLALMTEQRLRHLPVLEDGHPIGLLSRDELIEAIRSHQAHVLKEIELDQIVLFARNLQLLINRWVITPHENVPMNLDALTL